MRTSYIPQVLRLLQATCERQQAQLQTAAEWIADALQGEGLLYVFGAAHAGIITEELTYRAGGLVPVSPIFVPGLTCDVRPLPLTSALERLDGYALAAVKHIPISPADVALIHSVSGRNAAPVEVALYARQQGAKVIALTSLEYSQSVSPRSSTGYRLFEVADLVIDNGAPAGDAVVQLEGFPQPVAPVSTVLGAALVNAIVAEACAILVERGVAPPVFMSANLDGGDAHNARLMGRYKGRVLYL
ncbi:MAG: SIS domain-containing protein [Fimbriimonadales bacterium]|nr:SIS domain-containing protein [Fimbriimonadales bacterium]